MNNFPAMTEEQRQRLTGFIAAAFASMNGDERLSTGYEADMEALTKQVFEVALAALKAKPSGYVSNVSREIANDGRLGYISNHIVAGLEGGYVYDAPPAPVLRVPDGWIKCSERMPEIGSRVLVVLCGKYVQSADYRQWETAKTEKGRAPRFENQRGIVYGATHWMPLPPPPEASNEQ